jgi:nucleotide-binding universal stress UspA family protein
MVNMTSLLVLTDFSNSARNAAVYALELAASLPGCDVVLLHVYQLPGTAVPEAGFDEYDLRNEAIEKLAALENELRPHVGKNSTLGCQLKRGPLLPALEEVVRRERVSLVIAGSKHHSKLNEFLFGSTTKSLIDAGAYPLLIVPASVTFRGIRTAVLACELKDADSLPALRIHSLITELKAELRVLNVNVEADKEPGSGITREQEKLYRLLEPLDPEYHTVNGTDIPHEIDRFVRYTGADLLIVMHKSHGPVYKMLHQSASGRLSMHGRAATLILQEDGEDIIPFYSYEGRFNDELMPLH